MSINRSIVPRAQASMLAAKARAIFEWEQMKGCLPTISPIPVDLEPPYQPLVDPEDLLRANEQPSFIPAEPVSESDWIRLKVWVRPELDCDWVRNEHVLKQFTALKYRVGFEIIGNRDGILLTYLCHKKDESVVRSALGGYFPCCEFSVCREHPLDVLPDDAWHSLMFEEFYTPPPYSHLLTRPSELKLSPLESLINGLSVLVPPCIGVYQVIVQPVAHDHAWNHNVELLIDLEFLSKLYGNQHLQQRYGQQAPSAQINSMAHEADTKSHSDKPFFCAVVRVGMLGNSHDNACNTLRALHSFMNLFLHGGRPLESLTHSDYLKSVSVKHVRDMFRLGTSHRAGSILNSAEICGLAHIPPLGLLVHKRVDIAIVNSLPAYGEGLQEGTCIGFSSSACGQRKVCISDELHQSHVHIIGKPRVGKSSGMEFMCCEDIARGHGVAVIDPHGDLAEGVISRIEEKDIDRVLYFNPGHPDLVPLWNLLAQEKGLQPDRQADDRLRAFTQITSGWGHRLETLMRQAFYGLIHTGDGTLMDASLLLMTESEERERIRRRVLDVVENEKARFFWEHEIKTYRKDDFAPVQHKLSKLLLYDTVSLMFSQPENRINFREIMDTGKILIANLAGIGSEARDILGSLLLSMFHLAALSRSDIPAKDRKPFRLYVDEAHRFITEALEDMLAETRKYNCSVTLAHQYLSQFEQRKRVDAMGVVGTTIAYCVTTDDAAKIAKFLGSQVSPDDLINLEPREAIVRVGNDLSRITTPTLPEISDLSIGQRAKELSYQRYYRPAHEVRAFVLKRYRSSSQSTRGARMEHKKCDIASKEFYYDEFIFTKKA